MVYRLKLVSDEVSNFSREIEIDSENTFLQLRNTILESVGYSKDEIDSFYLCDDDWEPQEKIALEDMGSSSSDRDLWLMENTPISELLEDEGQKLIFQYDYMSDRSFFMELKEIIPGRSLVEPLCTIKRGKAPEQFIAVDEEDMKADIKPLLPPEAEVENLDLDNFGEDTFDQEDLDSGFDIMNIN